MTMPWFQDDGRRVCLVFVPRWSECRHHFPRWPPKTSTPQAKVIPEQRRGAFRGGTTVPQFGQTTGGVCSGVSCMREASDLSKCEKARLSEIYRAECGDERRMQPHARTPGRFEPAGYTHGMSQTTRTCVRCRGYLWTCEAHQHRPWPHDDCASIGEPCALCNGGPVTTVPPAGLEPYRTWEEESDE